MFSKLFHIPVPIVRQKKKKSRERALVHSTAAARGDVVGKKKKTREKATRREGGESPRDAVETGTRRYRTNETAGRRARGKIAYTCVAREYNIMSRTEQK